MFQIAQNTQVNLINLTFTNTTSYLIKNNGITNIFNSTFKDIDGKAIKNVGNLKLINTTFENINPNYKNPQAIYSVNYDDTGIIYYKLMTAILTIFIFQNKWKLVTNPWLKKV